MQTIRLSLLFALAGCADVPVDDTEGDSRGGGSGAVETLEAGVGDASGGSASRPADPRPTGGDARPSGADAADDPARVDATPPLPVPDDAGRAPGPDAQPVASLPPPVARPPAPPPDESAVIHGLAAERPDLLAASCVAQGGGNDFLFEATRRLRARDLRWGLVLRGGTLLPDRVGYFWGDGAPEGRGELYVLDIIARHCAQPGVDPPPGPAWLDDTAAGGRWTLAPLSGEPAPPPTGDAGAGPPPQRAPLPDHSHVLRQLADERPELLAASCVDQGGDNEFLFEGVRRLRALDPRWGLNWKRGNVGDMSQDVVDYFWADGEAEGRTEVYILDVIGGHCGDAPQVAFIDVTQATLDAGTIGRWTLQPLP